MCILKEFIFFFYIWGFRSNCKTPAKNCLQSTKQWHKRSTTFFWGKTENVKKIPIKNQRKSMGFFL